MHCVGGRRIQRSLWPTVQVEEYMEGGEQGPYAYSEEAYQAAQHMAAAQAAANNGQVGQYGAPSVHHDAQVRALCRQAHPRHSYGPGCMCMLQNGTAKTLCCAEDIIDA